MRRPIPGGRAAPGTGQVRELRSRAVFDIAVDPRPGAPTFECWDIEWQTDAPLLSDGDAVAPTLAEAKARGLVPEYEVCLEWARSLDMGES